MLGDDSIIEGISLVLGRLIQYSKMTFLHRNNFECTLGNVFFNIFQGSICSSLSFFLLHLLNQFLLLSLFDNFLFSDFLFLVFFPSLFFFVSWYLFSIPTPFHLLVSFIMIFGQRLMTSFQKDFQRILMYILNSKLFFNHLWTNAVINRFENTTLN